MARTGSSLTIQEVKQNGRKVVLIGPSLPFQGAAWGGQNRLVTEFYPGNGVSGTQHVMGPVEKPSSWEGVFRRTLMGKAPSLYTDETGEESRIVSPPVLRDILESIFRGGQLLRVVWSQVRETDGQTQEIERLGRCAEWEFPHDRMEDIQWKFEFHWVSRGNQQQIAASVRDDTLTASITSLDIKMNELATELLAASGLKPQGISFKGSKLTLGQLEALANAPRDIMNSLTRSLQRNINKIKDGVRVANAFRTAPYDVINSVLSATKNTIAIVNQVYDEVTAIPPEAFSVKTNVADITRAVSSFGEYNGKAADVARQADLVKSDLSSSLKKSASSQNGSQSTTNTPASSDIKAVYITRFKDTPSSVSLKFYNTQDGAIAILQANNLPLDTISFVTGKILIIPSSPSTNQSVSSGV